MILESPVVMARVGAGYARLAREREVDRAVESAMARWDRDSSTGWTAARAIVRNPALYGSFAQTVRRVWREQHA